MAEYASKGLANGLGIPAVTMAGLALLNQANGNCGNGGLLGGLFGGCNNGCNQAVNEKIAGASVIAEKDSYIAKLEAENYSDKVANEVYKQSALDNKELSDRLLDKYISPIAQEISDRRVSDARMEEQLKCLNQKMELREEIMSGRLAQAVDSLRGQITHVADTTNTHIAHVADKSACGISQLNNALACLQNTVAGITKTIVPTSAICPAPMPLYNSWTTPTTTTTTSP